MGLLADTLADAQRPLPGSVPTLRREVADEVPPESIEDDAAMTIYRLQKDGGNRLPAAPSVPRAGDAGPSSPIPAPVANLRVQDALPRVDIWMNGPETGEGRASNTSADVVASRQERFVSSVQLLPDISVANPEFRADSNPTPRPYVGESDLVQRDDSSGNSRRDGGISPSGRGAPSEDLSLSGRAAPTSAPAADATGGNGRAAASWPNAAWRPVAPRVPGAAAPAAAAFAPEAAPLAATLPSAMARSSDAVTADADGGGTVVHAMAIHERAGERHPPPPRAAVHGAGDFPPGAAASPPATESGPRLHIGRIEVVVLAPPAPPASTTAASDTGFLSRHYLRRL